MNLEDMTINQLQERRQAIIAESNGCDDVEKLHALNDELVAINAELEERKAAEAERRRLAEAIASGSGNAVETAPAEETGETEIRASKAYLEAWVRDAKRGVDTECRTLLTVNASGTVPVPTYVEGRIRTAWERLEIMKRVRKVSFRGNLQVGFERSATDAAVHTEGAAAPSEETLVLGTVTITPVSIKKWIRISDEAMDLGGEAFVDYVVDEITYRIAKAAQARLIGQIAALPQSATASSVSADKVTGAPDLSIIPLMAAHLSDETNRAETVVIINKLTEADFEAARVQGNFAVDPFRGLTVLYDSSLPAYSAATGGAIWCIVGDLSVGALANFPRGNSMDIIEAKIDDKSQAEADLVKIVGREYIGTGCVADKAFALAAKASL